MHAVLAALARATLPSLRPGGCRRKHDDDGTASQCALLFVKTATWAASQHRDERGKRAQDAGL